MKPAISSNPIRTMAIALLLLICQVSFAAQIASVNVQTRDGESYPVASVMPHVNSQPGSAFSQETLTNDIKRLYDTGFFLDVAADVDQTADGEIELTFVVAPVPRVGEIDFTGNEEIKDKKLAKNLTFEEGDLYDPQTAAANAAAIQKTYADKGYEGTLIEVATSKMEGNRVRVVFQVDEKERAKIKSVRFVGNTIFTKRQLLKHMRTDPTLWSRLFPVGFYSEQELEIDKIRLENLYSREGYIDFEITEVRRKYTDDKDWVSLTFFFNEGLPYIVSSVEVEGNKLFGDAELKPAFDLERGMVYNPVFQSRDIDSIRNKYGPLGYVDLEVRARLDKDRDAHEVAVTYQIQEGEASTIRHLRITGNEITRDEVIRRELLLHPGDVADVRKLEASEKVVRNLNYFETVDLTVLSTEAGDEKDLHLQVQEKPTGQLMAGAGFSSEDALIGTLQVTQTNFDWRNWPTFRGDGQRMRLQLQLGTETNNFVASFTEPWWLDRRLRLDLRAYLTTRDEGEYDREQTGVGTSLAWRGAGGMRHQAGLRVERFDLTNFDTTASPQLAAEEGGYTVTALSYSISNDTRDRFIHPTRGSRWELSAEIQPEALGTYSNIYKLGLDATTYLSVLNPFIMRLRGEISVVDNLSGDDVAIFDRLFAGGTSTFRGFDRREVSPVDVNEDPLGGKSRMLGTVEVSYPFTETIWGSVFCDLGNVWPGAYDWDPTDINVSIGVGVQLELPVGPIRFDYGFPIVTQQDHLDDGGRLHFNIGYFF